MSQTPPIIPLAGIDPQYKPMRTSGAAVTSLVLGVLLCIPVFTGVSAIIFGLVGIRSTRNPMVRGRGLALAGLILGIANLAAWGFGSMGFYEGTKADRAVVHAFVEKISKTDSQAADLNAASALCSGSITNQELTNAAKGIEAWGNLDDVTVTSINLSFNNGQSVSTLAGMATYTNGQGKTTHPFEFRLQKYGNAMKIVQFNFQ